MGRLPKGYRGMSQAQYARHRSCTPTAVRKAKKAGWLVYHDDGSIDPYASDESWDAQVDPRFRKEITKSPPNPMKDLVAKATGDRSQPPPSPAHKLNVERVQHERAKRAKTELQVKQMAGDLVSREDAERVLFAILRTARDKCLAIPARLENELCAISDPREIRQLLDDEIRDALAFPDVNFDELLKRFGA